jgi:hypothetical protein
MTKEQNLYNDFVDKLSTRLKSSECSVKDLEVIQKFIAQQGLQATRDHKGLNELAKDALDLPFEDENVIPLKKAN